MSTKKEKKIWRLTLENSAVTLTADGDTFHLYDETGKLIMNDVSRHKLTDFAFDHGADEVLHDYDLVKHGT